jgi:D-alanyl-D-alanine carboxypeptidase
MPRLRRLPLVGLAALVCAVGQATGSLQADLDAVFAAPVLAQTSALVQTLAGETLYERLPDRAMIPASNMKLVTCATALRTWGEMSRLPGRCYAEAFKAEVADGTCAPQSTLALLRDMDKVSSNRLADSFMRALLLTHGESSYDVLMHAAWRHLGLPLEGCVFADGSGLSRANRLTPRFLVALLRHMRTESDQAGAFVHTLPVAALDGTLKTRMGGTCAAGTVRAKTGFLTGVCTLSGYVDRNGRQLVFSMMMNGHTAEGDAIRAVQNRACVVMARSCEP